MLKATTTPKILSAALSRLQSAPGGIKSAPGTNSVTVTGNIEGLWISRQTSAARIFCQVENAMVEEDGEITLNIENLANASGRFTGDTLNLEEIKGGKKVFVTSGRSEANFSIFPKDENLAVLEFAPGSAIKEFELPVEDLTEILRATNPCVSTMEADNARGLTGVSFRTEAGNLYLAGTDQKTLMISKIEEIKEEINFVLHREASLSIVRAFASMSGGVILKTSGAMLMVQCDTVIAHYVLMEAQYPEILKMLNIMNQDEPDITIVADREKIVKAVSMVAPFGAREECKAVKILVKPGEIRIVGDNEKDAELVEPVDAECEIKPESPGEFMMNSYGFREILGGMKGVRVKILHLPRRGITIREKNRQSFAATMTATTKGGSK